MMVRFFCLYFGNFDRGGNASGPVCSRLRSSSIDEKIRVTLIAYQVTVKYVLVILHADNNGEGGTFSTYSLLSRYVSLSQPSLLQKLTNPGQHYKPRPARSLTDRDATILVWRSRKCRTKNEKWLGTKQIRQSHAEGYRCSCSFHGHVRRCLDTRTISSRCRARSHRSRPQHHQRDCCWRHSCNLDPPIRHSTVRNNQACDDLCAYCHHLARVQCLLRYLQSCEVRCLRLEGFLGFEYLIRHKTEGWKSLGGVLLAFTGVEALFADLGAFSRKAIQISWLGYTFPCLLLAYIGQAAYVSVHPDAYSNPFFNSVPPGTLYPSLVVAILAAVVASQAIITATFQVSLCKISPKEKTELR
jgi:KUP system potassium uptake protein